MATTQLTAKGLLVTVDFTTLSPDDANVGKVITQSQVAGTQVRKGSTIRLTVGKAVATTTTTTTTTTHDHAPDGHDQAVGVGRSRPYIRARKLRSMS